MREVTCPQCGKPVPWSAASPWRPFCSERCRMVDLGAWFAEEHAIPGDEPAEPASTDADTTSSEPGEPQG